MLQLIRITCFVTIAFGCLLTTFVFCFWFVYLLDAVRSKWKFYKNALRCLQQENFDSQQQILIYNSKTEFVKNVFLFVMNFIEWLALIFICVAYTIVTTGNVIDCQHGNNASYIANSSQYTHNPNCILGNNETIVIPFVASIFVSLANNCAVLSLVLVASLCMYLANRFSQCSWITSDNIPYLISLSILYQVVSQIIASFCSFLIIAKCFNLFLFTVSTLFALKQYRKLLMVINWTIVDLTVSGNSLLLKRQIKMKRTFTRIFTFIWIGTFLALVYQYLQYSLMICWITFRSYSTSVIDISFCDNPYLHEIGIPEIRKIVLILNAVIQIPLVIGIVLIYTPYICYGLSTTCVVLHRLYSGKSAYRTNYHNPLYASLF